MIVLHGVAELAESVSEYVLSFDNKNYTTSIDEELLHDNIILDADNPMIKTDGTLVGENTTIKIKIKTSNVANMSVKSAHCNGNKNSFNSAHGSDWFTKEEYLAEVSAFINTGRADFSLSSVGYNSPKDGHVYSSWKVESPESGIGKATVKLEKVSEDNFILEYDTQDILPAVSDCDWRVATTIELGLEIITKTGATAPDEKVSYSHESIPIVSAVRVSSGSYLTFDNEMAVIGGWWESSNIPVRIRSITERDLKTCESMFRYMVFGKVSPRVYSSSILNMAFTAVRAGDMYRMDKVMTNNLYSYPSLSGMTISSSGPDISGSAAIVPNEELGAISIDTSGVTTAFGEMHIEITAPLCENSCKFQIKSGSAPTTRLIVAAADARVVYNQISGQGTTGIMGTNVDNQLIGFHLFINGLQGFLIDPVWNPLYAVLGIMSMGVTCVLTGNMLEFVFFLYYESVKSILWDAERRLLMGEIGRTQEHYMASMAQGQQGVDAETRRKMARQWLEMTDSDYMRMSGPYLHRTFFLNIFCAFIPFDMPTSVPYTLGMPMYGVPMGEGVVEAVNTPDQILTDDVHAMMKKNAQYSMYRSRMDWAMALGGPLGKYATSWAWGGALVTLSIDGVHQELYSAADQAYSINAAEHSSLNGPRVPNVAISGEIGDRWDEFMRVLSPASRFTYWHGKPLRSGAAAAAAIAQWRGTDAVPVMFGMVNSIIIDMTHSTLTVNGKNTRDVIIHRPNPSVILAFEKP